jgi:tousled-like kinase
VACTLHQLDTQRDKRHRENYTKHATREYVIHKELKHNRIVLLFDVFASDENLFCIVMDFCDGSDLDMHLIKTYTTLSENVARGIMVRVALLQPPGRQQDHSL